MSSVCLQLCWEEIKPTLVTKLGQGSFGQVYEGWYHSAPMAVKIINVDRCSGTDPLHTRSVKGILQEVPPASKHPTPSLWSAWSTFTLLSLLITSPRAWQTISASQQLHLLKHSSSLW